MQPSPIFFIFFSNFLRFWYEKIAHIFFITHGKFHNWVFCLEDVKENMPLKGAGHDSVF